MVGFLSVGVGLFLKSVSAAGCGVFDAELAEDGGGGAEAGEGGLDEVEADESGEEEPPGG
jgi:hypothetical protein